ncbi:hypothetical protein PsYK624_080340 [Phanerochaete sordida]|uniref:Protein kinase domain-containing protein n=1 Tax=Phanerochaete sordida TaxID=48140 RepID=A0A9P3GBK5_9APHY|nr:hypothetical protein PsYK624_080340 [Phanerochaete sordida]
MTSATLTFDLVDIDMALPFGLQPLTSVGATPFQGPQQFIGTEIMTSNRATVIRGMMRSFQDPSVEREVVCKYRDGDISTIEHEASLYDDQLRDLQGVCVPHFYGLFKGTRYDREGKKLDVACIILEYFEEHRKWDLWKGPIQTRGEIAVAMLKIHFSGLRHCAFRDEHVLVSADGQVRIVDFARACEHDCDASPKITVWEWEPSRSSYGCNEMYDVMRLLGLWTPGFFPFMGTYVHIFSFPYHEDLAKWYLEKLSSSRAPNIVEEITQRAKETLEHYYAQYEDRFPHIGDPRKLKEERDELKQRELKKKEAAENETGPSGSP